ncbi:2005_t:CDS:2, partial [Diversispora eburnea]
QYQPALRLMQNQAPIGNPPTAFVLVQNITPTQNPASAPKGDLISFNENSPTLQLREENVPAVDLEIGSSLGNKTILIHKNISNGFEFYDGKRKWYGVKEDFHALSNKYYFIKTDLKEIIIETYKRIIKESEAITEKTNAPKRSEKVDEKENAWLNLVTTDALVFVERYEKEAIQYNVNSMYVFEMLKKEVSWLIASGIYTHYDLECAKENRLKVYLMNESPNALIYEKNIHITGSDMFEKWGNILYNIKKEGGTAEKKRISEIVGPLGDQVKRIHTDGFIVARQVNLKTDIEM